MSLAITLILLAAFGGALIAFLKHAWIWGFIKVDEWFKSQETKK